MKNNVIKLYKEENGIDNIPFPSREEQVVLYSFEQRSTRMGDAPYISAVAKHRMCLDKLWSDKVYGVFQGEKYYVINTPDSKKNNTDQRYEHQIQLLSEREVLNNVFFIDAVTQKKEDSCFSTGRWIMNNKWINKNIWIDDKYSLKNLQKYKYLKEDTNISNSTKIQFFGDIKQFVDRLNSTLIACKLNYIAVIDKGITSENKAIIFQDKYIAQALQEAFKTWEIPYYYKGRVIHFGFNKNAIPIPMKYGADQALLSISKNNANFKIFNRVTATGSEKNIPYYYPNKSANRQEIEEQGGVWITPSDKLMPSIYRKTLGKERFYNAINNTYNNPEGGFYQFENEFSYENQREGITSFEEIKPTIKEVKNKQGLRIDMFSEFAYDNQDNDKKDEKGNFLHPYFFAKLRKTDGEFAFNLFSSENEKQTMQISMTSGVCGACLFEIAVGEDTDKNIVQVDQQGNLLRDEKGNVITTGNPQDRQNDTSAYEVWIALKKDIETYKTFEIMPNAEKNLRPSNQDTFVILGMTMPQGLIDAAEKKLDDSIIKYMWMNNVEKFNFSIAFSRIFFAENPDILEAIDENARLLIEYDGKQHELYVDDYTYRVDENIPLPEIEVNLVDTISIGKNSLQNKIDQVKQDILSQIGGRDFLKQGMKYFIRKDVDDIARGIIKFMIGAEFGKYKKGEKGTKIDEIGNIITQKIISHDYREGALGSGFVIKNDKDSKKSYLEVDELFVRVKAIFTELQINKLSFAGGNWVFTPAGMKCSKVVEFDNYYRCFFVADNNETQIKNEFRENDQVRFQQFNIKSGKYPNAKNRYYWRLCIATGDDYIDLSKNDCDKNSDVPREGDEMICLGNRTDISRQNAIVISAFGEGSPSITQHKGINSYSLSGTEKTRISPDKNVFTGQFLFENGKDIKEYIDESDTQINQNIETKFSAVNGEIQASVQSLTEKIEQGVQEGKTYTDSQISVMDGKIQTKVEQKDFDALGNQVEQQSTRIEQNAKDITIQAESIKDVDEQVQKNTAEIKLIPDKISIKVKEGIDDIKIGVRNILPKSKLVEIQGKEEDNNVSCFSSGTWLNGKTWKMKDFWKMDSGIEGSNNNNVSFITTEKIKPDTEYVFSVQSSEIVSGNDTVMYNVAIYDYTDKKNISNEQVRVSSERQFKIIKTPKNVNKEHDIRFVIYSGVAGNAQGRSMKFKMIKLEEGNKPSEWTDAPEDVPQKLLDTGIDIDKKNVTVTADNFFVQSRDRVPIAVFTTDISGRPVVRAENMDAENFYAKNLSATNGTIAGFRIEGEGLTNRDEKGSFTNNAYIIFRNDKEATFAGIGGNVGSLINGKVVARFENKNKSYRENYALAISAQNARKNVAISIDGGTISGININNIVVSSNYQIQREDFNIFCINTEAEITLNLPKMKLYDDGHVVRIKRGGKRRVKIVTSDCENYPKNSLHENVVVSKPIMIVEENVSIEPYSSYNIDGDGSEMEFIWIRDISYTIGSTEYRGAWVQYNFHSYKLKPIQ